MHICRESDEQCYKDLLSEAEKWLCVEKEIGYSCMFAGCSFRNSKHKRYINHLKNIHIGKTNLLCNYKRQCKQRFNCISALESHVKSLHLKVQPVMSSSEAAVKPSVKSNIVTGVPCKCSMSSCGERQFASVKDLKQHYNSVIHKNERRMCMFQGCSQIFEPSYQSRRHFRTKHSDSSILKPEFILVNSRIRTCDDQPLIDNPGKEDLMKESYNSLADNYASDTGIENENVSPEVDDTFDFLKMFADLLNRLCYIYMIPQTTIQVITDEFLALSIHALISRKQEVQRLLMDENIGKDVIGKVLIVLDKDRYIDAQESLNSAYSETF